MPRLRRSNCSGPGIRRRRRGKGFTYHWPDGTQVKEPQAIERIKALVLPPAWNDVWICPWPNGHLQAIGVDAAGRRQYRYHDAWTEQRDREKFDRVLELGRVMPAVRRRVARDLAGPPLGRNQVLGASVRLLDVGSFRVGGEEYAEENESYGLATLLAEHVSVRGDSSIFEYSAKSGQVRSLSVEDRQVAEVLRALKRRRSGSPELLAWRKGRRWVDIRSEDINAYVKEIAGEDFSAKDFRTWNATVLAAARLGELDPVPKGPRRRRDAVAKAIESVCEHLGNTPAVCRTSYIDPRVLELFDRGETIHNVLGGTVPREASRPEIERAVIDLLSPEVRSHVAA